MARNRYLFIGLAIGFVLVLLYATIRSTRTPLDQRQTARVAATGECQRAIRDVVANARFPFAPNVTDLSDGRIHLSGSMDSGAGSQAERRNYECFLSETSSADHYVADSVEVWQSH